MKIYQYRACSRENATDAYIILSVTDNDIHTQSSGCQYKIKNQHITQVYLNLKVAVKSMTPFPYPSLNLVVFFLRMIFVGNPNPREWSCLFETVANLSNEQCYCKAQDPKFFRSPLQVKMTNRKILPKDVLFVKVCDVQSTFQQKTMVKHIFGLMIMLTLDPESTKYSKNSKQLFLQAFTLSPIHLKNMNQSFGTT